VGALGGGQVPPGSEAPLCSPQENNPLVHAH